MTPPPTPHIAPSASRSSSRASWAPSPAAAACPPTRSSAPWRLVSAALLSSQPGLAWRTAGADDVGVRPGCTHPHPSRLHPPTHPGCTHSPTHPGCTHPPTHPVAPTHPHTLPPTHPPPPTHPVAPTHPQTHIQVAPTHTHPSAPFRTCRSGAARPGVPLHGAGQPPGRLLGGWVSGFGGWSWPTPRMCCCGGVGGWARVAGGWVGLVGGRVGRWGMWVRGAWVELANHQVGCCGWAHGSVGHASE